MNPPRARVSVSPEEPLKNGAPRFDESEQLLTFASLFRVHPALFVPVVELPQQVFLHGRLKLDCHTGRLVPLGPL